MVTVLFLEDLVVIGHNDGSLRTWSTRPLAQRRVLSTKVGTIEALAYRKAVDMYAAATLSGQLLLGRLQGNSVDGVPLEIGPLYSVALSPHGRLAAAGSDDGRVAVWSIDDKRRAAPLINTGPTTVYALAFTPDGRTLWPARVKARWRRGMSSDSR